MVKASGFGPDIGGSNPSAPAIEHGTAKSRRQRYVKNVLVNGAMGSIPNDAGSARPSMLIMQG